MWNRSVTLVGMISSSVDKEGYEAVEEVLLEGVPADYKDVTYNMDVAALQSNYRADAVFGVMAGCYSGQSQLIDEATGDRYDIKKDFRGDRKDIVYLTCEKVIKHGTIERI